MPPIYFTGHEKNILHFYFLLLSLLAAAQLQTEFWGATMLGGSGLGTFFKTDSDGGNLVVADFLSGNNIGEQPSGTLTFR